MHTSLSRTSKPGLSPAGMPDPAGQPRALLGGIVVDPAGLDSLWILAVGCGVAGVITLVVTHVSLREQQS